MRLSTNLIFILATSSIVAACKNPAEQRSLSPEKSSGERHPVTAEALGVISTILRGGVKVASSPVARTFVCDSMWGVGASAGVDALTTQNLPDALYEAVWDPSNYPVVGDGITIRDGVREFYGLTLDEVRLACSNDQLQYAVEKFQERQSAIPADEREQSRKELCAGLLYNMTTALNERQTDENPDNDDIREAMFVWGQTLKSSGCGADTFGLMTTDALQPDEKEKLAAIDENYRRQLAAALLNDPTLLNQSQGTSSTGGITPRDSDPSPESIFGG